MITDERPVVTGVAPEHLSEADFRQLMSCWSTGVAVVTSGAEGRPLGCTVNAITSVSLEPPLLLVSLAHSSRTLAAIERRRRFGVSLLPAQRLDLARQFSRGDPADRFAGVEYDWAGGVPLLKDVVAQAVCVPRHSLPVADHVLLVAEAVWCSRHPKRSPLVCYNRAYWSLWSMARVGEL